MSKPRRYAEGTSVDPEKTQGDLQSLLRKHGASAILTAVDDEKGVGVVQCRIFDRMVRWYVRWPTEEEVIAGRNRVPKSGANRKKLIDGWQYQEWRRRWRALLLIVKAKLELVHAGDSNFDREFMADILLPDGSTVGDAMLPSVQQAYLDGKMPKLLLPGV